jgi:hypothetical protein
MGDEKLYARKTRKDEISVQKHIEWLQKEYKIKEGKEMLLVDQLMDINLFHRRKLVVSEQKDDVLMENKTLILGFFYEI